jgi:ATP-dependent DNA helicase RecQ
VENIREILIKYWRYYSFRPLQEEVIMSVMEGHDTLALFPTGGGKSITYQIPALAMDGLTLVVTPLIALMRDQVEDLQARGIKAAALYSGMHRHEMDLVYSNAIHGGTKLLYVSPERLKTDTFRENLPFLKVNLLAIDEAHCISQWGHDFRPPYREIANIRNFIPKTPVIALTASATPEVVTDIQNQLQFRNAKVFKKSFKRDNLTYMVIKDENKQDRLLRIIKKTGGSGIVYVRSRRKTMVYAHIISKQVSADYYHAGLEMPVRNKKQKNWMTGRTAVMVSTNAFGMGIDKPDVRFVVHLDIPDSIESYFQEAGRAGRDGKPSYAVLLYDDSDIINAQKQVAASYPPIDVIKRVYNAMGNFLKIPVGAAKQQSFEFDLSGFARQYHFNSLDVFNALRFLEKDGYIFLNDRLKQPSQIHLEAGQESLYHYQLENEQDAGFIKALLRAYPGIFNQFIKINEQELARQLGTSAKIVEGKLWQLQKKNLLTYLRSNSQPLVTYLTERLEVNNIRITPENYHERKKQSENRLEAMIAYTQSDNKCRSQALLEYFGDKTSKRCGRCDVCLRRNKLNISKNEFDNLLAKIRPVLMQGPLSFKELIDRISCQDEQKLIEVVRFLQDGKKIEKNTQQKYVWKPDSSR